MKKALFILLILPALLLSAQPASASGETDACYRASTWDRDGDGYAGSRNVDRDAELDSPTTVDVPSTGGVNCPAGYTNHAGDCDENHAGVHPRRSEIAFNGIDDDCDFRPDEADPSFSASGNANTTGGFSVTYRLTRQAAVDAGTGLRGKLWVDALDGSQSFTVVQQPTLYSWGYPASRTAKFTIGGLQPTKVYRVWTTFQTSTGAWLSDADEYLTTTEGTTQKSLARTRIVLKALAELRDSQEGQVGHRGTTAVDGTRYTASGNEKWCSEFYMWSSRDELRGMNKTSVSGMKSYFSAYSAYYNSSAATIRTWADRGDWVAIGKPTNLHHTGMVLAVRGSMIWTVEGNRNNEVGLGWRTVQNGPDTDDIQGLGHITYDMLP